MARLTSASTWTTWMVLTLGSGCGGPANDPGAPAASGGGMGGAGGAGTTTTGAASTSAAATTGAGGAPSGYVCDPPAPPGSLYELSANSYDLDQVDPVSMCSYRGEVLLIANTAAL